MPAFTYHHVVSYGHGGQVSAHVQTSFTAPPTGVLEDAICTALGLETKITDMEEGGSGTGCQLQIEPNARALRRALLGKLERDDGEFASGFERD